MGKKAITVEEFLRDFQRAASGGEPIVVVDVRTRKEKDAGGLLASIPGVRVLHVPINGDNHLIEGRDSDGNEVIWDQEASFLPALKTALKEAGFNDNPPPPKVYFICRTNKRSPHAVMATAAEEELLVSGESVSVTGGLDELARRLSAGQVGRLRIGYGRIIDLKEGRPYKHAPSFPRGLERWAPRRVRWAAPSAPVHPQRRAYGERHPQAAP